MMRAWRPAVRMKQKARPGGRAFLCADRGEHEAPALLDRCKRQGHEFVAVARIGGNHCLAGAPGLLGRLLAFGVLAEDFRPWRREEDAPVVAETLGRSRHMRRHGTSEQMEVADHVGYAAIKEHRSAFVLRHAVRSQFPRQHELGEGQGIASRQCRPVDRALVLNNGAAGFDRVCIAAAAERFDQRALARSRAAGNPVEALNVGHAYTGPKACSWEGAWIGSGSKVIRQGCRRTSIPRSIPASWRCSRRVSPNIATTKPMSAWTRR